jgi:cell division protein FtsN
MPPRKKAGKRGAASRNSNANTSKMPSFMAGMALGVVLTLLGMYAMSGGIKFNLGSGIKNLVNNRMGEPVAVKSSNKQKVADPKPVYDFYTVLPEYETVVDEKQFIKELKKPAKKEENSASYILQAASYSSFKDADKLKAKLALNGLSSRIEKISVEGKGQFFRVRLGPYTSTNTKKDVVKRLGTLGIKPLHLKVNK